ncbi:MAG: hypothetical protein KF721_11730 [Ignavibacteriaceae bacterium]|nr:hypothetical protein [Ignavibacteriaceae bacterium]
MHLLKFTTFMYEAEGFKTELRYLRNVDQKEVDFLVTYNNLPWFAVEVKLSDTTLSKNLIYFKNKLNIPYNFQVVMTENIDYIKDEIRIISASKFLSGLF